MIKFLNDFIAAFRAAFRAARQSRHLRIIDKERARRRAINQAARLAAMDVTELERCAAMWGGVVCQQELKRRGL